MCVQAPPRTGKTTGVVIPSVIAAPGPVVVTSTKRDVLDATSAIRLCAGECWLFDPSGRETPPPGVDVVRWSPVGAEVWYMAWTEASGQIQLAWSATPPAEDSYTSVPISETSIDTPSVVWAKGELWMAWTGTDDANTVNLAKGVDAGDGHYDKVILDGRPTPSWLPTGFHGPNTSKAGPQLQVWSETDLFLLGFNLAYVGHDDRNIYALMTFGDGTPIKRWKFADETDGGPGLVGGTGFSWSGLDGGRSLNFSTYDEMTHTED